MLDAGCGSGAINLILASRFPETEFVGIDLSDLLLEMARKKARERNLGLFVAGLVLVVYFVEKLVEGAVGTSLGLGISTFLVSVIFIGFDPDNLSVGAVASFEGVAGIAVGSIVGAAMVAIARAAIVAGSELLVLLYLLFVARGYLG